MAGRGDDRKPLRCSFCNKTQDQVRKLIAGQNVYIAMNVSRVVLKS